MSLNDLTPKPSKSQLIAADVAMATEEPLPVRVVTRGSSLREHAGSVHLASSTVDRSQSGGKRRKMDKDSEEPLGGGQPRGRSHMRAHSASDAMDVDEDGTAWWEEISGWLSKN